jgi:REP-associated tyrosine transposase
VRTRRPQRLKTFDYLGPHRYSLTFCTHFRERVFVDAAAVELVLSQFSRAASEQQFSVIAYCFMPDHVHLLVEGLSHDSDCKRFIKLAKQYAAYEFSKGRGKRLWQPWGFEHVLRDEELTHVVARYILENPVRAGLTNSVLDYPFVGSAVCDVKDLLDGLPFDRQTRPT